MSVLTHFKPRGFELLHDTSGGPRNYYFYFLTVEKIKVKGSDYLLRDFCIGLWEVEGEDHTFIDEYQFSNGKELADIIFRIDGYLLDHLGTIKENLDKFDHNLAMQFQESVPR